MIAQHSWVMTGSMVHHTSMQDCSSISPCSEAFECNSREAPHTSEPCLAARHVCRDDQQPAELPAAEPALGRLSNSSLQTDTSSGGGGRGDRVKMRVGVHGTNAKCCTTIPA